jgi:subtilisin family serine protease
MKKTSLIILMVILAIGLGYQQFAHRDSSHSPNIARKSTFETANRATSSVDPSGAIVSQTKTSSATQADGPSRAETIPLLDTALHHPVSIEHGGTLRALTLAKDELYVRDTDGIGRVISIPLIASASELLDQIAKVQKETASAPELILYPPGAARNESTRRIVTRDILIEADSRHEADSLAAASGLAFKSAPVYAKGKYIYEAPSSPEALAFFVKTADSESPYVIPLLASKVAKMVMPNDQLVGKQWHLKFQNQFGAVSGTDVNVESVWKYPKTKAFVYSGNATMDLTRATTDHIRGGNVTIGIVDDGMEWSHPDLLPNVLRNLQKDWNGKDNDPKPYFSDDNHGTACAGVAAARGNNRIGVSGVAPEANLVGMRLIADAQTDADIAEAMTWYANEESFTDTNENGKWDENEPLVDTNGNRVWDNDVIHIKSNSWGYGPNTLVAEGPLTEAALEYAAKFGRQGKGSILVFAAGNYDLNGDRLDYKGINNSIYGVAVGALDSSGKKSDYSNVGAGLMICAPSSGNNTLGIMTTDNKGPAGYNYGVHNTLFTWPPVDDFKGSGDVTQTFGGTSSATPAVSGVIALMLQRNPNLGWRDVQEILMRSAVKIDDQFPSGTVNNTATGWIVSDRDAGPNPVSGNATVPFKFNDKYGAGLVDAAAAVALSGNWTNLGPQLSLPTPNNTIQALGANSTINRTFTVNGSITRAEHVTLQLTVTDIPKGNLTITLTSPSPGNTTSTFCIPHSDTLNKFENWKFMTVRSWAENPNGNWTLTVTNNGTTTGNLTKAELVVYGTEQSATNSPTAMAATSTYKVFKGANIKLSATTSNLTANGADGTVTFSANLTGNVTELGAGTKSSNSTIPVYEYTWNTANFTGNYLVTANATSGTGASVVTAPIAIQVDPAPIAAWDFDTTANSPVPLATAVSSIRKYAANFGSGSLTFDGSFSSESAPNENRWDFQQGEIYSGEGTAINSAGNMLANPLVNTALLLRGGKNRSAEDKFLVFEFSMAGQENLNVTYAADALTDGFTTHTWSYSSNGTVWTDLETVNPAPGFSTLTLNQTIVLDNATTAYLRLQVSGSGAASGQNLIDNIILSATPIAGALGGGSSGGFPASAKTGLSSAPASPDPTPDQTASSSASAHPSQTASCGPSDLLDWTPRVGLPIAPHQMLVHAEVVDGARFVNAPGSVLSATKDGQIWALADPTPQSTRYELLILASEPDSALLRLKIYDSERKGILVLEEKVPFAPDATIGSSATPKRYQVAYQETEQVVQISPGWNTFTTAVDPDPATLEGALIDYDATEGDRLVGASAEASVVQGKWNPSGLELKPQATYTLLRQAPNASQIVLKGKALPQETPRPPHDRYGIWMNLPEGSVVTADWCDADGDEIDDRFQPGPGMPMQRRAPMPLAPVSAAQPAVPQQPSQPTASSSSKNPSKKSGLSKKSSKKSSKKQKATRKS